MSCSFNARFSLFLSIRKVQLFFFFFFLGSETSADLVCKLSQGLSVAPLGTEQARPEDVDGTLAILSDLLRFAELSCNPQKGRMISQ